MTTGAHPYRFAALTGLALTLPFVILQIRSGGVSRSGVMGVAALFALLWLLPTVSISSSFRILRPPSGVQGRSIGRVILAAVIVLAAAWIWGSLLVDQLPCFIGTPNCD
ncbi:MAG: hypothetical protein ACM357_09070 [Gemmatimonadota bacterium]